MLLTAAVVASAVICLAALVALVARTFMVRSAPFLARPQGSASSGILYAFGPGMLPTAKESARKHLAVYVAGVVYHVGIFAGLLALASSVVGGRLPVVESLFLFLPAAGALAGFGLLVRRLAVAHLRELSCPDDYAANIVVDLFLVAAVAYALSPAARAPFYSIAVLMFLYIPLGKIRHCVFFFYARILFGAFFGRRGVLPHRSA